MKLKFKILGAVIAFSVLFLFSGVDSCEEDYKVSEKDIGSINLTADYSSAVSYIIEFANGAYTANLGEVSVTDSDLSSLITLIESDGVVLYFSSLDYHGSITVSKSVTLCGALKMYDGNLNLCGENIILDDFSLNITRGSLKIKGGITKALGGEIYSYSSSAFLLDYSASSKLIIDGMEITSETTDGAVNCSMGSVEIISGKIKNSYGPAIENKASLSIGGAPEFNSYSYDVITNKPISLTACQIPNSATFSVMYNQSFDNGTFVEVFHNAKESDLENINFFDEVGEAISLSYFSSSEYSEEKSFIAVYMPLCARFYCDNTLYFTVEFLKGESISAPDLPLKQGYNFCGWYKDSALNESYAFGTLEYSDFNLYASFSLTPPEFSISSKSFVYDGKEHILGFDKLTHPLAEEGSFSFVWYKDSAPTIYSSDSISITSVSDSGIYFCKLTFAYNGDYVVVDTPEVAVNIEKQTLKYPSIPSLAYTGGTVYPDVPKSSLYTSFSSGGIGVGAYAVTLTLTDPLNYKWEDSCAESVNLTFYITQAQNCFLSPPNVEDTYVGFDLSVTAEAKFGKCYYMYSSDGVNWQSDIPSEAGKYYILISVDGTENYTSLSSEPIAFEIFSEICVGIMVDKYPDKTEYQAFETLSLEGAEFSVTYNSGRCEKIDTDIVEIEYKTADSFRVCDSCAIIRVGDASVPIAVTVRAADYDISSLVFEDKVSTYNGKRHTIDASADIVGLDGIKLEYTVSGGGIDVGTYTVTISFFTESVNYNLPDSVSATLTIKPLPVYVNYKNLSFTYDGAPKIPTAELVSAEGLLISVAVSGGATDAGKYTASAIFTDKNYTLINPTVDFEILKAELDLKDVYWSADSLPYNGEVQSVQIYGLPKNVTLVGYADSSFTDVGEYTTSVTIIYDTKNYNAPNPITHTWKITPIEYDWSSFGFSDSEYTFDGQAHFPSSYGVLPIGLDGSVPFYSFSQGVTYVAEGSVEVVISFGTDSKNYVVPADMSVYVKILPKGVIAVWENLVFTYNGQDHIPNALCEECPVTVTGSAKNAGEYVALASSSDLNYRIINPQMAFVIEKAPNHWISEPQISDYYEGGLPAPLGESLYGEAVYFYFSDSELKNPISATEAGTYYMMAYVPEGQNYLGISCKVLTFNVVKISPIRLVVNILSENLTAMNEITSDDICAYYVNNDESISYIDFENISIRYENGECLKANDRIIHLSAGGFETSAEIDVALAQYDMSAVCWSEASFIYDGEYKFSYLGGLPDGVSVSSYILNSAKDAGEYELSAILSYDTENYFEPVIPSGRLIIEKCVVDLPQIESGVYNGSIYIPYVAPSSLYTVSVPHALSAGEYTVSFILKDTENYVFKDGVNEKSFIIARREITVKIDDGGNSFTVTEGSIVEGDSLREEFYTDNGYVYLKCANSDYLVTVLPAKAKAQSGNIQLILILLLLFIIFAMGIFIAVKNRKKVFAAATAVKEKIFVKKVPCFETVNENEIKDEPPLETLLAVDEAHANSLIPDFLAKNLLTDSPTVIKTSGRKRCIVNVDTISNSFLAGDTVDINTMKEKGIVPKDAKYVKVLARGVIDKPINIIANSYSLAAVKMIALTGGSAKRAHTSSKH